MLPHRHDHADALALAGALTNISITTVPGIYPETLRDQDMPAGSAAAKLPNRAAWRAHMTLLRNIVSEGLSSALILEQDADWDVRIAAQLTDLSRAVRALSLPAARLGRAAAAGSQAHAPDIPFTSLPLRGTPAAVGSPYGDDWDVLILGHCGVRRPAGAAIVLADDATVPHPSRLRTLVKGQTWWLGDLRRFLPHTRMYHAGAEAICTTAYAVSGGGARKLLGALAVEGAMPFAPFDLMVREFCHGTARSPRSVYWDPADEGEHGWRPRCWATQPTLFGSWRGAGGGEADSDVDEGGGAWRSRSVTENVRCSARGNVRTLARGLAMVDGWPNPDEGDERWPDMTLVEAELMRKEAESRQAELRRSKERPVGSGAEHGGADGAIT